MSLMMFLSVDISSINVNAAIGETPTVRYESELSTTYYDSVNGLTGEDLMNGLATLTLQNHKTYTTYDQIRGGNAYSDQDPNDPTKLIDFYTGISVANDWDSGNTWNREHVWCQSLSGGLYGEKGAAKRHCQQSSSSCFLLSPALSRANRLIKNSIPFYACFVNEKTKEDTDKFCILFMLRQAHHSA